MATAIGAKGEAYKVYSRLGDEDFVDNVLRITGRPSLRMKQITRCIQLKVLLDHRTASHIF